MDSPEATKPLTTSAIAAAATTTTTTTATATISSDSPPVQSNEAAHQTQGFLRLNSPPLVFKSPKIVPYQETSFLQRSECPRISGEEIPKYDDRASNGRRNIPADGPDGLESSVTCLGSGVISETHNDNHVDNCTPDQPGNSLGSVEEYLSNSIEVDCVAYVDLVNLNEKQSVGKLQPSENVLTNSKIVVSQESDNKLDTGIKVETSQTLSEQAEEDLQAKAASETKPITIEEQMFGHKKPSNEYPNSKSDLHVDYTSMKQQCINDEAVASQLQHGMSRRCLQFEEAQQKTSMNRINFPNSTNYVKCSRSPASTTELECLDSPHVDLTGSSKKQMFKLSQPLTAICPPHNGGKSPLAMSKPSGIGLHLNSIVTALPVCRNSTSSITSAPNFSCHSVKIEDSCSKLSKITDKVSVTTEDRKLEANTSLVASSATSKSFNAMESSNMLQPLEHLVSPHLKRKFSSEGADNFEEFSLSSPQTKRKKPPSIDGDGCKRCNCKRTRCLKLYCDCFAAGIYCAESCFCQGCFNRPEYEDTVMETRQLIESRNPQAFAPKIVHHVTEFPASNGEDGNQFMPSSVRHKKGCNCKKSMCLKKYCECYQANVGCSNRCRCEGCQNVHGRKDDYDMTEEMVSNRDGDERLEGTADDKLEMVISNKEFLHAELYDLHSLTPSTPSFQFSDHGKDVPKSRVISSSLVLSESDFSVSPSYAKSTRSLGEPHSNDMLPAGKETKEIVSHGQQMDYDIADVMDQFSPGCDALPDMCNLSPQPNPSSITVAPSTSSRTRDQANVPHRFCFGSGRISSRNSLRWRSSPITPMTQLGETKSQGLDSDSGLYNILEDDTPEVLKEASSPVASVKVSSPNKKRVSPPHNHRARELGSSSSGGLKSGRKFILKSVPSFPPLTPCVDSKGKTDQKQ